MKRELPESKLQAFVNGLSPDKQELHSRFVDALTDQEFDQLKKIIRPIASGTHAYGKK
jgi:hypothetical protein